MNPDELSKLALTMIPFRPLENGFDWRILLLFPGEAADLAQDSRQCSSS